MKYQGLFFEPPLEANSWGHIMEEIYKTGLFEPFRPEVKEGSVVIDCGANVGLASYYFSSRFETVYAIEPSKRHFDVLNFMLDYNDIKNVKTFKFAMSMLDKESEKFYHYSNKTMDSLYGHLAVDNKTGLIQTGFEDVPLKRLDTFMKEQDLNHVNLLKLDVEGVEYEILGSEGFTNVADKIDAIVGEVHSYAMRNPNQIKDALTSKGFEFTWIPHDANLFAAKRK